MTLRGIVEALGLGATRDARLLVARLPFADGPLVATGEEIVARALERAGLRHVGLDAVGSADVAIAIALPDGDDALAAILALAAATREGGLVQVALPPSLGRPVDRARAIGLFLRAGLVGLAQEIDGGTVYTVGRVNRTGVA